MLLDLDSEQFALVEAGLNAIDAVLAARTERADPDRIITDSLKLQRRKLTNLRFQAMHPPNREWRNLRPTRRLMALKLMQHVIGEEDGDAAAASWDRLVSLVLEGERQPDHGEPEPEPVPQVKT